jgi:hypothetical protein
VPLWLRVPHSLHAGTCVRSSVPPVFTRTAAAATQHLHMRTRRGRARQLAAAAAALGLATCWPRADAQCLTTPGAFVPPVGPPSGASPFCARCEAGFYCSGNGSGTEVACPANTFAEAPPPLLPSGGGDGPRTPLAATSAAGCRACASGTFAPAGSAACSFCGRGFVCAANGGPPVPCPAGKYTAYGTLRHGLAVPCADKCAAGFFCPGDGTRLPCPPGTHSALGAVSAAACSAALCGEGFVCAGDGRGYRVPCPPGTWAPANATAVANCTAAACGAGYYCPGDGTRGRCPGTATSTPGAASVGFCYKA